MLQSHNKIRKTRMTPVGVVIASLPLFHTGLAPLREMGVLISGTDERRTPQEWGEGISSTHLLFFVTAGTAHYIGGDVPISLEQGQLMIVPAGVAKRLSLSEGESIRAIWFHLLDIPLWAFLRSGQSTIFPARYLGIIDTVQQQLVAESYSSTAALDSCLLLSRLLGHYLLQEVQPHASAEGQRVQLLLNNLLDEVVANPGYDWTVAKLAEHAGISPGHLHRLMRTKQQAGPMALVTHIRLQHAASLLRTTDWTLDRIANAVGYTSPYAFSHAFYRYTGMRPGAFRSQ